MALRPLRLKCSANEVPVPFTAFVVVLHSGMWQQQRPQMSAQAQKQSAKLVGAAFVSLAVPERVRSDSSSYPGPFYAE